MPSTYPSLKLSLLGLILAMVMSIQFQQVSAFWKFWRKPDQANLDMKALKFCDKNGFKKLGQVEIDLKSILEKYKKDLATILGDCDKFSIYLSHLKGIIREKEIHYKYMAYSDDLYRDVQEFENSKERTKDAIKANEAKVKLLEQLEKDGYHEFLSTYEICSCTERLEEFEGKNADEAQQICGKYLHNKGNFQRRWH